MGPATFSVVSPMLVNHWATLRSKGRVVKMGMYADREREFIYQVHNIDNTHQLLQWQAASGDISPS